MAPAAGLPAAPRFDLRFAGRRGVLRLARPLEAGAATIEQLELSLGPVSGRLELAEGAASFRHRRAVVRRARVRVSAGALVEVAAARGTTFTVDGADGEGIGVTVRDGWGAIATTVRPWADGADVVLVLRRVRAVEDGPAGPWRRLAAAASRLGWQLDPELASLRVPRPLHAVLREALVPRGWRVPDERVEPLRSPRFEGGALLLESGPGADGDDARSRLDDLERARTEAPAVRRLADDAAQEAAEALGDGPAREAPGAVDGADELALAVALERGGAEAEAQRLLDAGRLAEPVALAARVRLALRAGEADDAARWAARLDAVEPSGPLAAHALAAAAERLVESRPDEAQALLERALVREPGHTELALRWLGLAEARGRSDGVEGVVRRALASPAPETVRARIAAAGGRVLLRAGDVDGARALLERARRLAPGDPAVLEGLASAREAAGELERAVELLDRVAAARAARDERAAAARADRRAAALLARLHRDDAAEHRLERALERHAEVAQTALALARLRRDRGALEQAAEAYARLLHLEPIDAEALEEAARFHLDEAVDLAAARAFAARLERAEGGRDAARAVREAIARREDEDGG